MTIQELIDQLNALPKDVRGAPAKVWDGNTGYWYSVKSVTPFDEDRPASIDNQIDIDINTDEPEE